MSECNEVWRCDVLVFPLFSITWASVSSLLSPPSLHLLWEHAPTHKHVRSLCSAGVTRRARRERGTGTGSVPLTADWTAASLWLTTAASGTKLDLCATSLMHARIGLMCADSLRSAAACRSLQPFAMRASTLLLALAASCLLAAATAAPCPATRTYDAVPSNGGFSQSTRDAIAALSTDSFIRIGQRRTMSVHTKTWRIRQFRLVQLTHLLCVCRLFRLQ